METMTRGLRVATEQLSSAFAVTRDAAGLGANEFEGMASVFNVPIDAWMPTIIEPGAFRKTLQDRAGKIKVLWQHDQAEPIGLPTLLEETPTGLHVRAKISDTDTGRKALTLVRDNVVDSMSIGFDPVIAEQVKHDDGSIWRHLREIKLFEISLVTIPANESAKITSVHSVVPFQDLPLADEARGWSRSEAESRVRAWAGGSDKIEDMDWGKYRKAFIWYDGGPADKITSYKLQVADIVDNKLQAVPRAVYACAIVMQSGRGGEAMPADEKDKARAHIARYYVKLGRTAPWEEDDEEESMRTILEPFASMPFAETHVGKVLSSKNKTLVQDAINALNALIAAAEPPKDDDVQRALTANAERLNRLRDLQLQMTAFS